MAESVMELLSVGSRVKSLRPKPVPGVTAPVTASLTATQTVRPVGMKPPSLVHTKWKELLDEFLCIDANSFTGPLERPSVVSQDLLYEALLECAEASQCVADQGTEFITPLCTVEHDTVQLSWHRHGANEKPIPLCSNGDNCSARTLNFNQGPLGRFLLPSEEELFQQMGDVPDGPGPCLLCIRETLEALSLARAHSSVASAHTQRRNFLAAAMFTNAVDVAGGYRRDAIGCGPAATPASGFISPANVVGSCRSRICVRMCPETKRAYVDQTAIMYNPAPATPNRDF